ncbi:hypothetical protein BCR34DRAFT_605007 [Clohesyomyces aquaticus]|uniref:Uncharacterized protein n=1 Tax=Clohesyomyces aquaticus TaxID=1231657 RepID=A0A1Y1Z142_9PLEO|nr:hypothetical protein BCR34DRAFT_605007 [Clohesyomyces aquaticus]
MTAALETLHNNPSTDWRDLCVEINQKIESKLSPNNPFGKRFLKVKQDHDDVTLAYNQGRLSGRKAPILSQPEKGLLHSKKYAPRKGKAQVVNPVRTDGIGGYQVQITPSEQGESHFLRWFEDTGEEWTIGPVVFPKNIVPDTPDGRRFLYYVGGGLDIRNEDNASLGDRDPIPSGGSKDETLPISIIVLATVGQDDRNVFLHHWEDMTDISSQELMSHHEAPSFSHSLQGLYYGKLELNTPTALKRASQQTVASPMALGSLPNASEQGRAERLIASNALNAAFEILRSCTKKTETLILKVEGERKDSSRAVLTPGKEDTRPQGIIRDEDEPELEGDAEIELLDDVTDNEEDTVLGSRKRGGGQEDDEEDDEDAPKVKHAKLGEGKYPIAPKPPERLLATVKSFVVSHALAGIWKAGLSTLGRTRPREFLRTTARLSGASILVFAAEEHSRRNVVSSAPKKAGVEELKLAKLWEKSAGITADDCALGGGILGLLWALRRGEFPGVKGWHAGNFGWTVGFFVAPKLPSSNALYESVAQVRYIQQMNRDEALFALAQDQQFVSSLSTMGKWYLKWHASTPPVKSQHCTSPPRASPTFNARPPAPSFDGLDEDIAIFEANMRQAEIETEYALQKLAEREQKFYQLTLADSIKEQLRWELQLLSNVVGTLYIRKSQAEYFLQDAEGLCSQLHQKYSKSDQGWIPCPSPDLNPA